MPARVLILAGTAEARALCGACAGLDVLASLAGATAHPADLGVPTRVGGFGGEAGFRAALAGVRAVLDATHPFAEAMTDRAVRVCGELGVPYLRLTRAGWPMERDWCRYGSAENVTAALRQEARVLLTTGPGSLESFIGRGLALWCRRVDRAPPKVGVEWIVGTPPFSLAEETALLRDLGITDLVTKNSGGPRAKLDAAGALGVRVHVIDRPVPAGGAETHDIAEALDFVRAHAAD